MPAEALQNGTPKIQGKIRFQDFAPDADHIIPGVLLDMSNLVPTAKGWRSYPRLTPFSSNALPSACIGAFAGAIGDNLVVLAGVSDALYYLDIADLTDSGLSPTATTGRWRFDMYAQEVIAVNGVDAPFVYDGTTFGNLPGSPPVSSIVQATEYALFLILANSSNWRASLNSSLWTPSIATQTVAGTLRMGDGHITAAQQLRGGIAMYKRNHLSFGQFSGPPFYWDFGNGVSDQIGTYGQECVANLGDVHYFPGPDDFYSFDGYSLQRIPNMLKEWFFEHLNQNMAHLIAARWDQKRSLIFWHFPSVMANPETTLDAWICFNLRTGKWSADLNAAVIDMPTFSAIPTGQLTYQVLGELYPLYSDHNYLHGDLQSRTTDISGAFKSDDKKLHIYNAPPGEGMFTTHDLGDRESLYQVTKAKPHYTVRPVDGATIQALNQRLPGSAPEEGPSRALSSDGEFNIINTARLQRYKHIGESEYEVTGIDFDCEYAGEA